MLRDEIQFNVLLTDFIFRKKTKKQTMTKHDTFFFPVKVLYLKSGLLCVISAGFIKFTYIVSQQLMHVLHVRL